MNISYFQDQDSTVFRVTADDGSTGVTAFRRSLLAEGSTFAAVMATLATAFDAFASEASAAISRLLPAARADELRKLVTARLAKPYREAVASVQGEKRNYAAAMDRISEPPADLTLPPKIVSGSGRWISAIKRDGS
jgi:hypothetical protein